MSNDTETLTLTDFLLARIAEDEQLARAAEAAEDPSDGRWWVDGPAEYSRKWWVYATGEKFHHEATARHIARHDPARVLVECEAKRQVVERATALYGGDYILAALSLPYADHPDYREEWRP